METLRIRAPRLTDEESCSLPCTGNASDTCGGMLTLEVVYCVRRQGAQEAFEACAVDGCRVGEGPRGDRAGGNSW